MYPFSPASTMGGCKSKQDLFPSSSLPSANVAGIQMGVSNSDTPRGCTSEQKRVLKVQSLLPRGIGALFAKIFLFFPQEKLEIWVFVRNTLPPINVGSG